MYVERKKKMTVMCVLTILLDIYDYVESSLFLPALHILFSLTPFYQSIRATKGQVYLMQGGEKQTRKLKNLCDVLYVLP